MTNDHRIESVKENRFHAFDTMVVCQCCMLVMHAYRRSLVLNPAKNDSVLTVFLARYSVNAS